MRGPAPRTDLACPAPAFRTGGNVLRHVLLIVLLPVLALSQGSPPVPNGRALLALPPGEFQSYVSGIIEGQMVLAAALRMPQAICIDPILTRADMAKLVALGLTELPKVFLALPARVVVFRILLEKTPCPGFTWEDDG